MANSLQDEMAIIIVQPEAAGIGFENNTGDYHCFLNTIVQCLWHLTEFRDDYLKWVIKGVPNEVVNALAALLHSMSQAANEQGVKR